MYVADREGDLTALMQRAEQLGHPADWLIWAKHNRSLGDKEKLWDTVTEQSAMASIRFTKSRRKGEKAREVCQEIKVLTCCLHANSKTPTTVTLVEAREIDPPDGKTPLVWRLLTNKADLQAALTYFKNHRQMMDYATHTQENWPISSGVTEAACKTLVKQRLCGSGMRWKSRGAKVILSLRALIQSKGRWQQF